MRSAIIFISFIFLLSCNSSESNTQTKEDSTFDNKSTNEVDTLNKKPSQSSGDISDCYWKILNRDTFVLHLQQSNGILSGKLTFNNFEKDKSSGKVHGKVEGDLVKLWYDFQSEGMQSVMEVYFKRKNNQLLRGFGPVEMKGDSSYFKDHAKIEFNEDQTFENIPCTSLPLKYQ
jgi:hypothetical protein